MKETLLAAGGTLSALAASTCCILPLALVSAGVSGAWIGNLTALATYQPIFMIIAVACLGTGFWLVYRKSAQNCPTGQCVGSGTSRFIKSVFFVKGALWIGAVLATLSVSIDIGARLFL